MKKVASSQAAWALLTEGVTRARIEAHRLQHQMNRAGRLIESSDQKEQIYQVAGDLIVSMPGQLDRILLALDRTALALSKMGETFLTARLPLSEKELVEEAVEPAGAFRDRSSSYADLARQLGALYREMDVLQTAYEDDPNAPPLPEQLSGLTDASADLFDEMRDDWEVARRVASRYMGGRNAKS